MRNVLFPLIMTGLSTLLLTPVARAQDGAAVDMTGMGIYAMESAVKEAAKSAGKSRPVAPGAARKQNLLVSYRPSLERRRKNYAQFVAKTRSVNPQSADQLEKLLAQKDIIAVMGQLIGAYGLRIDNVADAYTIWWMEAWFAAQRKTGDPTRGQIQAVKRQVTQTLSRIPKFASASDAAKQEMAETLLIQAMLIDAQRTQAKNDPAKQQAVAAAANQGARRSGLDLNAFTLTENGFVPTAAHH